MTAPTGDIEQRFVADLRPLTGTSVVYFFGLDKFVKIGWTNNIAQRYQTLCRLPLPLEIPYFCLGTRTDECRLHQHFAEYRRCNEWFWFDGELLRYVNDQRVAVGLPAWTVQ